MGTNIFDTVTKMSQRVTLQFGLHQGPHSEGKIVWPNWSPGWSYK